MPSHMSGTAEMLTPQALSQLIDHTKLTFPASEQTDEEQQNAIVRLCRDAVQYGFKAVCIRPRHVALARQELQGSGVLVATVIGFPSEKTSLARQRHLPDIGNVPLGQKMAEVEETLKNSCDEFDLVMNVGQFLNLPVLQTLEEFKAIRNACQGKCLKVILETDLLTPEQIRQASVLCAEAGADFVKTSTGMLEGGEGGNAAVVGIIHEALEQFCSVRPKSYDFGIKASGGIKTLQQVLEAVRAGANRIGTSNGVQIYQESLTAKKA